MSNLCPQCGGLASVISSKICSNGARRRRIECSECGERWTTHQGDRPGRRGGVPVGVKLGWSPLTPEEVRQILLAEGSLQAIAKQLGRSPGAVRAVRLGKTHADLFPELPRQLTCTCVSCCHWSGRRCGLGYPDPEIEGVGFAQDCAAFAKETP